MIAPVFPLLPVTKKILYKSVEMWYHKGEEPDKGGKTMFSNIGRKIKITAKVLCWIGIISSVAGGVGMIAAGFSGLFTQASGIVTVLGGIGTALLGSLLSWVGSFMMVGFGELVENSAIIAASMGKNEY